MLKVAVIRFLLFWGVWLLVPMAVDGITAIMYLWVVWRDPKRKRASDKRYQSRFTQIPVTVLVPIYNAERTLYRCLQSIAEQDYPLDFIEVICVGNNVSDRSRAEFGRAQRDFRSLRCSWIDLPTKGKSRALNAGIHSSSGDLIFNVDADVRLAKNAIRLMVAGFAEDATLAAASGSIQVDLVPEDDPWWWQILNACEVVEYLQAFRVGRKFQTHRNAMFTLSGAFAAFRREVLVVTHLYDDTTVSEDTKITFDIRTMAGGKYRIGCIEDAQAFVEPIHSLSRFMSQRLRWQRGELEVLALYPEYYKKNPLAALGNFVGRILISDHTLAFPRLVWVAIIPYLYLLGYSLPLLALAVWLTYFMYMVIELAFYASVRYMLRKAYNKSPSAWWFIPIVMPIYRFLVYWFRLAGMLYVLSEDAQWSTENEIQRVVHGLTRLGSWFRDLGRNGGKSVDKGA